MSPHEIGDRELREKWCAAAEIAGQGAACPTPDELWNSARMKLARRANESVILHMSDCSSCATSWRLARDLVSDELTKKPKLLSFFRSQRFWAYASAAAVVIAVAGLSTQMSRNRGESPPVYRSQEGDWLRPQMLEGAILARDDLTLRWAAGPEGTAYDIRITTEDLLPIGRAFRLNTSEYRVDSETIKDLPAGSGIHWQVTAYLPDGRQVTSRTFTTQLE